MSEQMPEPAEPVVAATSDAPSTAPQPPPAPPKAAGYPFSVLAVIGTAIRVTKRNFVPFFALACVLAVPSFLLQLSGSPGGAALSMLMSLITNALTSAVVAYGVIMELHGSRPSARACITTGLGQIGRVIGVTVGSAFVIFGATLLFIIPGIIVALMLYVIVPITVVEGLGVRAAMTRSRQLTGGRKGDLFLIAALGVGLGIVIELVARYELGHDAAVAWRVFATAFSTMFFAVTTSVVYVELRKLAEGIQVPELATAFARIRK